MPSKEHAKYIKKSSLAYSVEAGYNHLKGIVMFVCVTLFVLK